MARASYSSREGGGDGRSDVHTNLRTPASLSGASSSGRRSGYSSLNCASKWRTYSSSSSSLTLLRCAVWCSVAASSARRRSALELATAA